MKSIIKNINDPFWFIYFDVVCKNLNFFIWNKNSNESEIKTYLKVIIQIHALVTDDIFTCTCEVWDGWHICLAI